MWRHFVPFQADVRVALEKLRQREFKAGRFTQSADQPATSPRTIDQALARSDATGTRSVLDMADGISPTPQLFCVSPLSHQQLIDLFGTDKPTRESIEKSLRPHTYVKEGTWLPNHVDRGKGIYVIVYADDQPREIFFAGYSFD
jgi:CTP:molybdopterin cytidylyltransferase MocA